MVNSLDPVFGSAWIRVAEHSRCCPTADGKLFGSIVWIRLDPQCCQKRWCPTADGKDPPPNLHASRIRVCKLLRRYGSKLQAHVVMVGERYMRTGLGQALITRSGVLTYHE